MSFYNIDICLVILNMVGLHPEKRDSRIQLLWYLFISLSLWFELSLGLMLFFQTHASIIEYIEICYNISNNTYGVLIITVFFAKRSALSILVKEARENFWKLEDINTTERDKNYFKKSYDEINIKFFTLATILTITCSYVFFPFLFSSQKVLPFNLYQPSWTNVGVLLYMEFFVCIFAETLPLFAIMTLFMTITTLTQMQFRLLNREIELHMTVIQEEFLNSQIKKILDHQNFLMRYTSDINSTFSGYFLGYLGVVSFSICLQFYSLSISLTLDDFLKSVSLIIGGLFPFMIFLVKPAQDLSDEIESPSNVVYFCDWYSVSNSKVKHVVLMMIRNSQKRVALTAGGLIEINMNTFVQILKSIYSYYAFLRTISLTE